MEMRFKIKEIPYDGTPLHVRRPVARELLSTVLEGTDANLEQAGVELDVDLFREHDNVIARGSLKGAFEVPCGRCVEPAKVPVDVRLDALFLREGSPEEELDPEDADAVLNAPDTFDHDGVSFSLDDAIRDVLISELPIAPVCSSSCKGLCAVCGKNQNVEACGHVQVDPLVTEPNSGLAALKNIKLPS
jgi:uncharacterized protein